MSDKTTKLIFTDMKKIIFTLAVALIALHGTAQETNFSLRPAVKVEKSVTNKFSLQLAHQTRYYTDLNEFERFSASLEGKYSFSKNWDAGLAYAWLYKHQIDDDFYASRTRQLLPQPNTSRSRYRQQLCHNCWRQCKTHRNINALSHPSPSHRATHYTHL